MTIRVAINGYGRIGRCILRALYEYERFHEINVVAINELSGVEIAAHLTRYDSTHGRFATNVAVERNNLIIEGKAIEVISVPDPQALPWQELGVELVFECTGRFASRQGAEKHLNAGAKKVLISAPANDVDAIVVYGVNHTLLRPTDRLVSNASCTTNCLAPIAKPLNEALSIINGMVNTVHAYTRDQLLLDGSHRDLRRARSATQSIIPTKTGATEALGFVLPELAGKLDGMAMRVPTLNVSVVDLSFVASRNTTAQEVNDILRRAESDIMRVNDEPLVSCDFNHNPASAIVDLTQTKVLGNLVKVIAWYDNEWGFSNRMLDTAYYMMKR